MRLGMAVAVDALEDEARVRRRARLRERAPVGVDQPERVLARDDRVVVEHVEEDDLVLREAEARPVRARPLGSVIGIGIRTTGLGDTARSVSATKALPAQTSSTASNAERKYSGKSETSHHQSPIVWRPAKNLGPAVARPGASGRR